MSLDNGTNRLEAVSPNLKNNILLRLGTKTDNHFNNYAKNN